MDIITDLSAYAVSFFCAYQDVCDTIGLETEISVEQISLNIDLVEQEPYKAKSINVGVTKQIDILIFNCPQDRNAVVPFFFKKIKKIAEIYNADSINTVDLIECAKTNVPIENLENPYNWRQHFRSILYANPTKRTELVNVIEYMPLLVVKALGAEKANAYNQRIYQVWGSGADRFKEKKDDKYIRNEIAYHKWWNNPQGNRKQKAIELLENDKMLMEEMRKFEVPIPFESLLNEELDEVNKLRTSRKYSPAQQSVTQLDSINKIADPFIRASEMELRGLAFSGGGIRSATFNLGVLQKLSELDQLSSYDYLSTVSGGGYIGSWFISWLKHVGSIKQLSILLNANKSADPLAEEVRPIRWLRMYSNYLSPNTGIMSADSWTMGLTWLRNTLINQVILVLLLSSMLAGIAFVFEFWKNIGFKNDFNFLPLFLWTFFILSIGAAITASGMRLYDREYAPPSKYKFGSSGYMPTVLLIWAAASSFFISAWMKTRLSDLTNLNFENNKIIWPVGLAALFAMLILAIFGRYYLRSRNANQRSWFWFWIIISSIVASYFGGFMLTICWQIIRQLRETQFAIDYLPQKLIFIFGLPLILETYSLSVIIRMLLMGNLFPDERREWWGRLGAIIHRFILIWIIITIGALVLPEVLAYLYNKYSLAVPAIFGGWGAIIGVAVKLAFQSPPTENASKKNGLNITEIFIRFAPYLFMIGFLLLGSTALNAFKNLVNIQEHSDQNQQMKYFCLTAGLFIITMFFSYRLGVNEFSLHHFYRNRLTRAYLGATRRRMDRESSANKFTGFDNHDDIRIAALTNGNGYVGPYPIINTALNASTVSELDRQDRKAESFTFSPLYCGFDFSSTRTAADTRNGVFQYGYRPTKDFSEPDGPTLGTAMAISGAAVNPNMGYHSSAPTAFLLTIFNVRLGRWIGNTRLKRWKRSDPISGLAYLIYDMIGKSDINKDYVCLSDGGHFDNMGLYELVRRKCKYILLCDAEEDVAGTCEGLANAIRRCRIDFGVEITIKLNDVIQKNKDTGFVKSHVVKGEIKYPGDEQPSGKIIYIKPSLTESDGVDIRQYYLANDKFPQQSTGDQFYDEAQFESYRKLGYESIDNIQQLL